MEKSSHTSPAQNVRKVMIPDSSPKVLNSESDSSRAVDAKGHSDQFPRKSIFERSSTQGFLSYLTFDALGKDNLADIFKVLHDSNLRETLLFRLVSKEFCAYFSCTLGKKVKAFSFLSSEIFRNDGLSNERLEFAKKCAIDRSLRSNSSFDIGDLQNIVQQGNKKLNEFNIIAFSYGGQQGLSRLLEAFRSYFSCALKICIPNVEKLTFPLIHNLTSLRIQDFKNPISFDSLCDLKHLEIAVMEFELVIDDGKVLSKLENLSIFNIRKNLTIQSAPMLESLHLGGIDANAKITLPKMLPKLTNFSFRNNERGSPIVLPDELNNLESLSIGICTENNFKFPKTLNQLRNFACDFVVDHYFEGLKDFAENLISFSCQKFYDSSYENKAYDLLYLLKNLRKLHIGTMHGDDGKYLKLENLTHFSIDSIDKKSVLKLSKTMSSLVDIKIKSVPNKTRLKLPTILDNLTDLYIGNIDAGGILEISNKLDNLKTLKIGNIYNKVKVLTEGKNITCQFISLLPNFSNLQELTIEEIINKVEKCSIKSSNAYSSEESSNSEHSEHIVDSITLHLPSSLNSVNIKIIENTQLDLKCEPSLNLINMHISNIIDSAILNLSCSFNNIVKLKIGHINKNSILKLQGSLNNIKKLEIYGIYSWDKSALEIAGPLCNLEELFIDGIRATKNNSNNFVANNIVSNSSNHYYIKKVLTTINKSINSS